MADATKMATKRKHHEVTLKVKYETLKKLKRVGLIKVLQTKSENLNIRKVKCSLAEVVYINAW